LFASIISPNSQEHHHLLKKLVLERATNGEEKEENAPWMRIGQLKRQLALLQLFSIFPLVI